MQQVLVVEDDPALAVLISGTLERAGYATTVADTGEAALRLAREVRPDAVVAHVNLPGISGYEVCHTVRDELGDGVGFILVSGSRIESLDRVAGLLIGADDYLVKPFEPEELVARVRAILRRRRSSREAVRTRLTPREREVLGLLANGLDQHSIASELRISGKTVGTHIEHILRKLDVHSRAQAVAAAYREELLPASTLH